jgi:hypothetical protein
MPSSVKISDLPAITSIVRGDIVPVVDESLTQTNKATLGQIKDMEAGTNSVVNASIASGAVSADKQGHTANDSIYVATSSHPQQSSGGTASSQTTGSLYTGREITCTPYIQKLMEQGTGPQARAYLDSLQSTNNAIFSGQTRFPKTSPNTVHVTNADGTLAYADPTANPPNQIPVERIEFYPALVSNDSSSDPTKTRTTGIYWPSDIGGADQHQVGMACDAEELFLCTTNGLRSRPASYSSLLPMHGVRAFASATTVANSYQVIGNPHTIASYVGRWPGTLRAHSATLTKLNDTINGANSAQSIFPGGSTAAAPNYGDLYNGAFHGAGSSFTQYGWSGQQQDGRYNYTTPHDNYHWWWTGSAWATIAASGVGWIGSMVIRTTGSISINHSQNISSVVALSTPANTYRFTLIEAMPTDKYAVLVTGTNGVHGGVYARTTTHFDVTMSGSSDPTMVAVIL